MTDLPTTSASVPAEVPKRWTNRIRKPHHSIETWLTIAHQYEIMEVAWKQCMDVYWILELLELLKCRDERLRLIGCRILRQVRNTGIVGGEKTMVERYSAPVVKTVLTTAELYAAGAMPFESMENARIGLLDAVNDWNIGQFEIRRLATICDANPLTALRAAVGLRFPFDQRENVNDQTAIEILSMIRAAYTPEQYYATLDNG